MKRKSYCNIISYMLVAVILVLGSIGLASARSGGFSEGGQPGGFNGPGPALTTAAQAATMRDDSKVVLRGNIIRALGGEDYVFKDASGEINVEIDNRKWNGQNITPSDTVEIYGEVDRDWNSVEIDVKRIVKIN